MSDEQTGEQNAEATAQPSMADIAATVDTGVQATATEGNQDTQTASPAPGDDNVTEMQTFIQSQNKQIADLKNQVTANTETVDRIANAEQTKNLNHAVDNAIKNINDGVNGNDKLADAFLNSTYKTNSDFKTVFDNRDANPKAYEQALGVLKTEWASMNTNQVDTSVAENQRALQESMRSGTSSQGVDPNAKLDNMSNGEFMREMRRVANSS